jgi:hypothetical protein
VAVGEMAANNLKLAKALIQRKLDTLKMLSGVSC